MSNITTNIKGIRDIMRKDTGVDGDAQRISQMVWMLFMKIFADKEEEEEMLMEIKEMPQVQIKIKELEKVALKDIGAGVCPASFDWLLGTENYWNENGMGDADKVNPKMLCQVCSRGWRTIDGYRCTGGTHFFCGLCVQEKVKEYRKEAMKKAKAEYARTHFDKF